MSCKCGATTYEGHLREVEQGKASAHVYKGSVWSPVKGMHHE